MTKMRDAEVRDLEGDLRYWTVLANYLGWRVLGFTYRYSASFITGEEGGQLAVLNGKQRDDIVAAIERGVR